MVPIAAQFFGMRTDLLTVLLIGLQAVDSYKILVYNPTFGQSHSNFMGGIADILVEAGHNVTSIVSVISNHIPGGSTKLSKIIKIEQSEETFHNYEQIVERSDALYYINMFNPIGAYFTGTFFGNSFASQCKRLIEEPGLIQKLKEEKFDVLFAEHFDMCGVAIYVSKLNVHSIWDRLVNLYADFVVRLSFNQMRTRVHEVFQEKFGANFPSFEQISSNSAYVFTNTEPLLDYAVPTVSKVIPIGGINTKEPKKLSEYWEKILSKRKKNVIVSFGSIAYAACFPVQVKRSILEAMKALPNVTFIWKYEIDDEFTRESAPKVNNLVLTKWMPQVDLLAHPNVSAFITHGGMGSIQETALRGVPGIFIPIFGDQMRNAGMMDYNRLGKVLDKHDVTNSIKFTSVIREVLDDPSYRYNVRRVSAMLHKLPFAAKEKLIKYTEFAAEFGPSKALRPRSYDMNWIEYHNVDIFIMSIVIAFVCTVISLKIVRPIIRRVAIISKFRKD